MRAAVIGGGTMGVQIAHAFVTTGSRVIMLDVNPELARRAVAHVYSLIDDGIARGKIPAAHRFAMTSNVAAGTSIETLDPGLDVIVEAVPEKLELKRQVLAAAERRMPHVLATNTSGISIDRLADALKMRDRFVGLHFYNPVWAISLVEVVVGMATSDAVRQRALAICKELGKEAIVVADSPGFASTRLGLALGLEAMRMLQEGVASAEDIDRAMELGYRHPMGPLRLSDVVGLDVRLDIAYHLAEVFGARFAPPRILVEKVAKGELGKKTGQGFYRWDKR